MVVLGLTGSIAMGKTTAAKMVRRLGIPVFDADGCVHALLARNGRAVDAVGRLFPEVIAEGAVDRAALARRVFASSGALASLEAVLHPLVRERQSWFLKVEARQGRRVVVLDIPLLFETGGDTVCDAVAVVSAPEFVQRRRLRERPGLGASRLHATLARQMTDVEKRRRADYVIPTGLGKAFTFATITRIVADCSRRKGGRWMTSERGAWRRRDARKPSEAFHA